MTASTPPEAPDGPVSDFPCCEAPRGGSAPADGPQWRDRGAIIATLTAEVEQLKDENERWIDKANEAGKAYADANTKHHEELDRANRLEAMCERLAERALDFQDALRAAERARDAALARESRLREAVEGLIAPGVTPDGEPLPEWVHVDDLRALLAAQEPPAATEDTPIEQGEWWDADHDRPADAYTPPERTYCRRCGMGATFHDETCAPTSPTRGLRAARPAGEGSPRTSGATEDGGDRG